MPQTKVIPTMSIPEPYESQIIKWASMGRTIDCAANALIDAMEFVDDKSDLYEQMNHAVEELQETKPFADFLHYTARVAIYNARGGK